MYGSCELIDDLHNAQTKDDLLALMTLFNFGCGSSYFLYCDICLDSRYIISNYPEGGRAGYRYDLITDDICSFDCAKNAVCPILYSDELRSEVARMRLVQFREVRQQNILDGVLFAVPLGANRLGVLTLSGERSLDALRKPQDQIEAAAIIATLHAKVLHAHKQHGASSDCRLTPRQAECMSWAADGKTASETATILCLSESSVIFHLKQARKRLNAVNLPQAVRIFVESRQLGDQAVMDV